MSKHTSCKDCIFAEYKEETQVGCSRGILEKYRNLGINIVEAYDYDKEFYVIENRLCQYYRTQEWANRFEPDTFDENVERMLEYESRVLFHVMVFMQDSLEDVQETLVSLISQDQPPLQVTIIRPRASLIKPRQVLDLFSDDIPFRWRLENLWFHIPQQNAIHMVQKVVKSNYYTTCNSGYRYKAGFFSSINKAVTKDLLQFAMIEGSGDDKNGIVIPLGVHEYWHFQGNHDLTIPENVREFQCKNTEKQIVFTMKQIRESHWQEC